MPEDLSESARAAFLRPGCLDVGVTEVERDKLVMTDEGCVDLREAFDEMRAGQSAASLSC